MKYYIFSDLHEDEISLKKTLDIISSENEPFVIYSLGDNVGFSKHYHSSASKRKANKCIDLLIKNNVNSVIGNHDLNFLNKKPLIPFFIYPNEWEKLSIKEKIKRSGVWLYLDEYLTKLSKKNHLYIEKNTDFLINDDLLFSHFLYPDFNGNLILKNNLIEKLLPVHFIFMEINKLKISFVGHLHTQTPILITSKKEKIILNDDESLFLDTENLEYIIFCPSLNSYKSNKPKFIKYCDKTKKLECYFADIIEA